MERGGAHSCVLRRSAVSPVNPGPTCLCGMGWAFSVCSLRHSTPGKRLCCPAISFTNASNARSLLVSIKKKRSLLVSLSAFALFSLRALPLRTLLIYYARSPVHNLIMCIFVAHSNLLIWSITARVLNWTCSIVHKNVKSFLTLICWSENLLTGVWLHGIAYVNKM